jgi:branched-chain amino acid transport system ATP-binding protein
MMLQVEGLETAYGRSQVLFGLSLSVGAGEVATLLGRNGMGKTTTVRSIMGMVRTRAGTIRFGGKALHGLPSYRVAQAGLGLVPEGRQVFPNLTVRENLVATAAIRSGGAQPWTLDRVYALFPHLAGRERNLGSQLSGIESLKASGLSILIIDKDLRALTRIADRHYVIEKGRVVWSGASSELAGNREMQHRYLGV